MATLEQLQDALVNADKAGDAEAARILADEIVKLQSGNAPQQPEAMLGADRRMANDTQVAEQTAAGRQEAYDQQPWYKQALQAGQDVGRLLESGATMGFGDKMRAVSSPSTEEGVMAKINAGLNYINPINAAANVAANTILGGSDAYKANLEKERDETQAARDRARSAALPAEITGAVMTGSTVANTGATLAGRLGTGTMTGIKGVLARAGLMAPEGALYGTLDALGNDKDVKTGAVTGAIAAPVGSVVSDTVSKVASKILPAKTASKVPSLEKLREAADDAYAAADNAGVIVNPQSIQRLRANVEQKLVDFGYHPQNQPGVKAALDEIDRLSQGNVTFKGLDVLRRVAKNAYTTNNPSQNAASQIVVNEIDDFMRGLNAQDVVMGDKMAGLSSLKQARELWTRVRKNEKLVDAMESAALRAASTGSGGNVENATRQELRRFIDPKLKSAPKNWTPDEAEALNNIVKGTLGQNTLRLIGKLSPTGNGLNIAMHLLGATATGGASVPIAGIGAGSKYLADRGVRQGVQALDELIRTGGSKAQLQAAQATLRNLSQSQREAVARIVQMAIIQSEVGQQQPAQ